MIWVNSKIWKYNGTNYIKNVEQLYSQQMQYVKQMVASTVVNEKNTLT